MKVEPLQIVADTSSIIAVLLREPTAEFVAKVIANHRIIAPRSIDFEVGNALVMAFRRKRITEVGLVEGIAAFANLKIVRAEVNLTEALVIAAKHGIYAYDAYMIQCAASQKLALLTLDQALDRAARAHGVGVVEVLR